jgi:phosphatidate cytidylyltransferase
MMRAAFSLPRSWLKYRLIFGPVLVAAAVGLFWLDRWVDRLPITGFWRDLFNAPTPPGGLILALVLMLLVPLAARELVAIFRRNGVETSTWITTLGSVAAALTLYLVPDSAQGSTGVTILGSVLVACFLFSLIWHSRHAQTHGVIAAGGAMLFVVVYLGVMGGFFLAMRTSHSAWVVLGVILVTKCGDIGAYFTGRAIGRHKLIPWLSPGKTWEGLVGGVVLAGLAGAGFAWLSQVTDLASVAVSTPDGLVDEPRRYSYGVSILAGVLFALVGHAGDLTVSAFKRDVGIKDSGTVLPGFGGILDVLDSPLLVAPVAYWMLQLATQ